MNKVMVLQCPAKYIDVLFETQKERVKLGLWDKYYLVTDYSGTLDGFAATRLDRDYNFGMNLKCLMQSVSEDVFFFSPIDHKPLSIDMAAVCDAHEYICAMPRIGMIRLWYDSSTFPAKPKDFISPIIHASHYLSIGGMGIWRKEFFCKGLAINGNRTAWDFDARCGRYIKEGVYGTNRTVFVTADLLERGKRRPKGHPRLKEGIKVEPP